MYVMIEQMIPCQQLWEIGNLSISLNIFIYQSINQSVCLSMELFKYVKSIRKWGGTFLQDDG